MNKKLAIVAVGLGLVVAGTLVTKANAQESKPQQTIIQKLVAKFGLSESDVKSVFDEVRSERQTQMQTRLEDKLDQSVKDGKITEVQKQAILAKRKELQANKLASRETQKTDLEAWAKTNGIDLSYLQHGYNGFMHGRMGWHMK